MVTDETMKVLDGIAERAAWSVVEGVFGLSDGKDQVHAISTTAAAFLQWIDAMMDNEDFDLHEPDEVLVRVRDQINKRLEFNHWMEADGE